MDQSLADFGGRFAGAIIDQDFDRLHGLLASWLRAQRSPEELRAWVDEAREELPYPGAFEVDGNPLTVAELRADPSEFGPPSEPIPDEVTDDNFRKWMCVQMQPGPPDDEEFDACFDAWMVVVEEEGELRAGYLEATDPD